MRIVSAVARHTTARGGNKHAPEVTTSPASSQPAADPPDVERIGIPVKDGRILWDRVRESRRDDLKALIRGALSEVSGAPAGAPLSSEETGAIETWIEMAYGMLSNMAVSSVQRAQKCSIETAQVVALTDDDKEKLIPITAKIVSKWMPSWGTKYGDELLLLGSLFMIGGSKAMALQAALAAERPPITFPRPASQSTAPAMTLEPEADAL